MPKYAGRSESDDMFVSEVEAEAKAANLPAVVLSQQAELANYINSVDWRAAALPEDYERLKQVVAKVTSIDLLKDAADKLDAIATTPLGPTFKKVAEEWTTGALHERFPDHVEKPMGQYRDTA